MRCNVCSAELGEPIFDAGSEVALTSLCELRKGRVRVWSCGVCGHLRGDALTDTEAYYESDYRIMLGHDDEDQIYEVKDERIVYRTEHQVSTLLEKLRLSKGALLLDYGCAKASTPKSLLAMRPDLAVHLFDVSEMYTPYWNRFVAPERQAVHKTPGGWQTYFDVVTSFFALEHIPDLRATVRRIADLLNDDGCFYGIVPDTFGNVADFIVIDHVNHFTVASLHALLSDAGFLDIDIDASSHRGALVFVARKAGSATSGPDVDETVVRSKELARYWERLGGQIRASEQQRRQGLSAIYGSGFYGAYILSTLVEPGRVTCFLDRSPFRQGESLLGKPVLAPSELPPNVDTLYIGLNPSIAKSAFTLELPRGVAPIFLEAWVP